MLLRKLSSHGIEASFNRREPLKFRVSLNL